MKRKSERRKNMRKILSVLLISIMMFTSTIASFAATPAGGNRSVSSEEIINRYVDAINAQDAEAIIKLSPTEEKEELEFYFEDSERENLGIRDIISAKIVLLEKITDKGLIYASTDLEDYQELYGDTVEGYLLVLDLKVKNEDKYFQNGYNANMVLTAEENGEPVIVEFSDASRKLIDTMLGEFRKTNSKYERLFEIKEARSKGIILNSKGDVIETNIATKESLIEEMGGVPQALLKGILAPYTRPQSIKVYRVKTKKIETVDFYEYCKNVLPNEWVSSWGSEALKAGAMCVKMVGWFRVESPKYAGKGYDVRDDDRDQVYRPNTAVSSCTKAINNVGSNGIQSAGYLFFPRYLNGREGFYEVGGWDGGTVSQWGTKKFADNGYEYLDMLHYYYDYTDRLDGNPMYTFTY